MREVQRAAKALSKGSDRDRPFSITMIEPLLTDNQQLLETLHCVTALLLRRRGASFRRIAKGLAVGSEKAERLVERGQELFGEKTEEELAALQRTHLRELQTSLRTLAVLVCPKVLSKQRDTSRN